MVAFTVFVKVFKEVLTIFIYKCKNKLLGTFFLMHSSIKYANTR